MEIRRDTSPSKEGVNEKRVQPLRRRASFSKKSIKEFEKTFNTEIAPFETDRMVPYKRDIMECTNIKRGFHVTSKDEIGKGLYDNIIDVDGGKIIGITNDKNRTENWHFSDIVYNQLQLVLQAAEKDISGFDLKSWYGYSISNEGTKSVVLKFIQGKREKKFEPGSDGFAALANTPTAKSKFYLLEQHPEAFPGKRVTSITVIRQPNHSIDIEYEIGS